MRAPQARRTHQPFVDVQEPGKGKALLHVLADGRCTGQYKLSKRRLEEVRSNSGHSMKIHYTGYMNYTSRWATTWGHAQVPEVWQPNSASDADDGKWWEAVDTVALDLSHNSIRSIPAEISELSETLETLNIWCAAVSPSQNCCHILPDFLICSEQLLP